MKRWYRNEWPTYYLLFLPGQPQILVMCQRLKFGFITAKCRSGSPRRAEFVSAGLLNIKRSRRPNMSNVSES